MAMSTSGLPRVRIHARSTPSQSKAAPKRPGSAADIVMGIPCASALGSPTAFCDDAQSSDTGIKRKSVLEELEVQRFLAGGLLAYPQRIGAGFQPVAVDHHFQCHRRYGVLA